MSGSTNWLGSPPDPNNALNPFARRVMTNPIGTEVAPLAGTPTAGVPQGDFNALVGFGSGGAPITMADAVRAQGHAGDGPGRGDHDGAGDDRRWRSAIRLPPRRRARATTGRTT